MKYELLVQILFTLLAKSTVTAKYLSEKYEISPRTVYRYMENLELAGIPVVRTNGRNGGFSIPDSYRLPASFFTEKELLSVKNALLALQKEFTLPELDTALTKLCAMEKRHTRPTVIRSGNVIIDSIGKSDSEGLRHKTALLTSAANENKKVVLDYHNVKGDFSKRIVHPYFLLLISGIWYLYGYCEMRKEFRLFRVGRIASITLTEEAFKREDIPLPEFDFDALHAEKTDFLIKIAPAAVAAAEDVFGVENMKERDGEIYFSGFLPDDDMLLATVLQFGANAEVIRPASLRERVQTAALSVMMRYQ
ncbi:MAG: YafY family transcriptional regulator [Clostridia bacterium]|nr:YafY family transcriptional regulator [Clostridia bacterium]MBQ5802386.1 YafY family transcriptional regulator [Clostridia bacterium]